MQRYLPIEKVTSDGIFYSVFFAQKGFVAVIIVYTVGL